MLSVCLVYCTTRNYLTNENQNERNRRAKKDDTVCASQNTRYESGSTESVKERTLTTTLQQRPKKRLVDEENERMEREGQTTTERRWWTILDWMMS